MSKKNTFGLAAFGIFVAVSMGSAPQASAQSAPTILSRLYTCGDGHVAYVNQLVPKTVNRHRQGALLSRIESVAGEGYSQSQAGIYIEGISNGILVTKSLSYQVRPLNSAGLAAINCSQGTLLRDDGTLNGVPFKIITAPSGQYFTIVGPDAYGFYSAKYDLSTIGPYTFNNLALFATNGGAYDIKNFAINDVVVPLDLQHPLVCPIGTDQTGISPDQYCGP